MATAMEGIEELLRTQFNTSAIFVSPPGMLYWVRALQQFVYMLTEICSVRRLDFFLCATNLRVGQDDLRPAALSAHAYLAATFRLLQSTEQSANALLTWDDAIYYDHGMRMGWLTFDQEGNRLLLDARLE